MTQITCVGDLEKTAYATHASVLGARQGTLALLPNWRFGHNHCCAGDYCLDMFLRAADLDQTHNLKTCSGASVLVSSSWFGVHQIQEIVELDNCTLLLLA
jgi:hypothetical protein